MIRVPLEFVPSQLLTCEMLSKQVNHLLQKSRDAFSEQHWSEAQRFAVTARDASRRILDEIIDYALTLIHLADIHRTTGRLGPALEANEEAQQLLKNQPGPRYYHNRAVADYALGLTHHALGSDNEALFWYDHAGALFQRASHQWGLRFERERQDQCIKMGKWIDSLARSITQQTADVSDTPFSSLAWMAVFRNDDEDPYHLARLLTTCRAIKSDAIQIGGETYVLSLPDGNPASINQDLCFRQPYLIVEIPAVDNRPAELDGDLALVQVTGIRREPPEATEQIAQGKHGDFVRDEDGHIYFMGRFPHIIGEASDGGEDKVIGGVIGLLKETDD